MKIYVISTTGKPPRSRFPNWAELDAAPKYRKNRKLSFDGNPYPTKWKSIELHIIKPLFPKPDIFGWGGALVVNERVATMAGEPLEMSGELLPVTIQGEKGNYYIYNL